MKTGLTKKQTDALHFLRDFIKQKGFPPTIQEICTKFGFASTNAAYQLLGVLEKKGWIERGKGSSRSIRILQDIEEKKPTANSAISGVKNITVIGDGSAENPMSVFLSPKGQIAIDTNLFSGKKQFFAVTVEDDGMSADGILRGDFAIVEQKNTASNGNLVVTLYREDKFLRKYFQTGQAIELLASSKGFPKLRFAEGDTEMAILGVVRGIIRKFE